MLPLMAGAIGLTSAVGGIYGIGQAFENKRYWDTYYRNTGRKPRYPYRTGYYNYNNIAQSLGRFGIAGGMISPWEEMPPAYGFESYRAGGMYGWW